ncbi:unnamed protein product, partial [Sphacelaria rigidula]
KRAWDGLVSKYQNSSKQRRRTLMLQLDGITMAPDQDPDVFFSTVFQLRDELRCVGEVVSEERLTDIIIEGISDEYDLIKYNAERDLDLSISDIENTMRNMYANRVARR